MSDRGLSENGVPNRALQLDMFEVPSRRLTNTIALWDVAPRSVFRTDEQPEHDLKVVERRFVYGQEQYQISISSARFKRGGVVVDKFPGEREQLVEEVIRQIGSMRGRLSLSKNNEIGLSFSVYEVCKELSRTGHEFSFKEVQEALIVLSKASIDIVKLTKTPGSKDKSTVVMGSTFPMLVLAEKNDSDAKCMLSFNWLMQEAVRQLDFRQIDYEMLMKMPNPMVRWLYRWFSHEVLFFDEAVSERRITALQIVDGCGASRRARLRDNLKGVVAALDWLVSEGVVVSYEADAIKDGRQKLDVEYTVQLSERFINANLRANRLAADSRDELMQIRDVEPGNFVPTTRDPRSKKKSNLILESGN